MSSENWLWGRSLAAQHRPFLVKDDTVAGLGPVSIRLRYIGSGTVTSVTITTATNLVLITSDGGTDTYTFADADKNTLAELINAINADGIFEAKLVDDLLYGTDDSTATPSANHLTRSGGTDGAVTAHYVDGVKVWDLLVDTSVALYTSFKLSYDRGFAKPNFKMHRVALESVVYSYNPNAVDKFCIYEVDPSTLEATKVYSIAGVDTTETTVNFAAGYGKITSDEGKDLVVRLNGDTLPNGHYMNVLGIIE